MNFESYSEPDVREMPVIGLTKSISGPYPQYAEWLRLTAPDVVIIDLETADNPLLDLRSCDGLVLTGGPDIDPVHYGIPEAAPLCRIDAIRDALDLAILKEALRIKLPTLAICRGLQVVNVALGGTLIADLPSSGKSGHDKTDGRDAIHPVAIAPGTVLGSIVKANEGGVNSSHHQSAGVIAEPLIISAVSPDGVVEALEWRMPDGKGFLLCVQWHPERQSEHPFSRCLAEAFLHRCALQRQEGRHAT